MRSIVPASILSLFFFNSPPTTEIYTLSLHDALPIYSSSSARDTRYVLEHSEAVGVFVEDRSEEHTSELQSRFDLVCRLLLEKKKKPTAYVYYLDLYSDVIAFANTHLLLLLFVLSSKD